MVKINGQDSNPIYAVSEIWFSLLERATLIGAIKYIADTKHSLFLQVVAWISILLMGNLLALMIDETHINNFPIPKYEKLEWLVAMITGIIVLFFVASFIEVIFYSILKKG